MKILGCDLHAKQQSIAMVDTETGEFTEKTLSHEGNEVREFYAGAEGPVVVGIEATGAMQWFLELLEELGDGSSNHVFAPMAFVPTCGDAVDYVFRHDDRGIDQQ